MMKVWKNYRILIFYGCILVELVKWWAWTFVSSLSCSWKTILCKELVLKGALALYGGLELVWHESDLYGLMLAYNLDSRYVAWTGFVWSIRRQRSVCQCYLCFSFKKSHWLAIVTVGCVLSCLVKMLVMISVISVKDAHYMHIKSCVRI